MPIWAVAFYDDDFEIAYSRPSRHGVVKAKSEADAGHLVAAQMRDAKRADLTPQVVRDESALSDGYRELPPSEPPQP